MNKKLLFGLMSASMLFATSCNNEDELVNQGGETVMVSFDVATPEIATRAYSDGTTATVLQYAVYNEAGDELTDLRINDDATDGTDIKTINGSAKVTLPLVTGDTYSVIFWAAAEEAPYTVDFANKTMTVNYTDAKSNDENRDAFYAYKEFTVNGAQTEKIELKRPFAQLNIGTADYDKAESAGYVPTQTSVTVSNVYSTLNLADGVVDGEVADVTFGFNAIPTTEDFPVASYEYSAMNYLLVRTDKEVVDVEFSYADNNNKKKTRTIGSVPVQRNYRTNIYGNLLTSEVDVEVEIVPDYNEEDYQIYNVVVDGVSYNDFATAAAKAMELNKPVEFVQNVAIDADSTITVEADKVLTLNLNGYTLSGVSDQTGNRDMFLVKGTMNVNNGIVTIKHVGDNLGWSAMTTIFDITAGGEVNLDAVNGINYGGSDMGFVAHLNNWGEVTLNVENSTLESNYVAVRVFNSGYDKNNVTVKNSTLKGGSYAFWVHNYTVADFGTQDKADAQKALLNLDIFNGTNEFIGKNATPIRYGFTNASYADEFGFVALTDANGNAINGIGVNLEGETGITNQNGFNYVAEQVNNGNAEWTDANLVLGTDIDLAATRSAVSNWTPIGTSENPFTGTFDGKGKTIKNLTLVESEAKEGKAYIGFFGYAKDATIQNVTFENVTINIPCLDIDHSQGHIGAVAGSLEGTSTIENVTIKGDIQVYATQTANGASRVAVVAGGNSYGDVTMKNVHVIANEGSYLIANNNTGALAGQLQGKSVFENCSSNINVTVNKFFAGGIIGLAAGDQTFINCHTTGNIAVVAGREGRAHDQYRVGGIAGGWADGAKNVCTLTNCSYTGNISGKNSDGSVANPLDYAGYVGRGYTLNGCQGSTVMIDGISYVQKYNTADKAGIYTINGLTPVATADELVAALEANEGVLFLNDIKIEPASMSNAYGTTGINIKKGQTIDGAGHTLNIKGAGGTWDSGINTTGGLIKNITVTGSFRGIFINHNSDHSEKVVLENVTITGTTYTISCDQGKYQGLEATNCTFNGWTSYAKTLGEAKFVRCSFGEGNGYKYCRPYSDTEFVECTFCTGYEVDQTRANVTFTDCSL